VNLNCEKVWKGCKSYSIADVMTAFIWLIKYLGDKLLCGHVPVPFPWCRTGSGHARLGWTNNFFERFHADGNVGEASSYAEKKHGISKLLAPQNLHDICLKCDFGKD